MIALLDQFIPATAEYKSWQEEFTRAAGPWRQFKANSGLSPRTDPTSRFAGLSPDGEDLIGIFALAPSGYPLATLNQQPRPKDPRIIEHTLRWALNVWKMLPDEKKFLSESSIPPSVRTTWRWAHVIPRESVPRETLVLKSYTRDLPRHGSERSSSGGRPAGNYSSSPWVEGAWNSDHVWLEGEGLFFSGEPRAGQRFEVPRWVPRRLARFHLVDNVLGKTLPFEDHQVEVARMQTRVEAVSAGRIELSLVGRTRAVARGLWAQYEAGSPEWAERGFETEMRGWLTYDRRQGRFITFDMVAVGERWGGTPSNRRFDQEFDPPTDDRARAPIGVAFTLFPGGPEASIPPGFAWDHPTHYFSRT